MRILLILMSVLLVSVLLIMGILLLLSPGTLTNYLRARFRQDKIYLTSRSDGTFFAIDSAA